MKCLLVLVSCHHENTKKVAEVLADELDAAIKSPGDLSPGDALSYDLIGLGSGIYAAKLHPKIVQFADQLPQASGRRVFLFSTAAIVTEKKALKDHGAVQRAVEAKGYEVIGHFSCRGFNTNSFLKYVGGMNRGRPSADDLKRARAFARELRGSA